VIYVPTYIGAVHAYAIRIILVRGVYIDNPLPLIRAGAIGDKSHLRSAVRDDIVAKGDTPYVSHLRAYSNFVSDRQSGDTLLPNGLKASLLEITHRSRDSLIAIE
jgi:hypothetical protein